MFLGRKEVNFWPAYADMMFVLFILFFVMAVGAYRALKNPVDFHNLRKVAESYRRSANASEMKVEALKNQLKDKDKQLKDAQNLASNWKDTASRLQEENDKLKRGSDPSGKPGAAHCGLAEDFVTNVLSGLEAELGKDSALRTGCGVTLKEALLFDVGRAEIKDRKRAETVVTILLKHALNLINKNPTALDSIIIEGHADSKGFERDNYELGLRRSQALFEIVQQVLKRDYDRETQFKLRAYLSNRSFGEFRPLENVYCSAQQYNPSECQPNRRVEIAVVGRVGTHAPNWRNASLLGNDD